MCSAGKRRPPATSVFNGLLPAFNPRSRHLSDEKIPRLRCPGSTATEIPGSARPSAILLCSIRWTGPRVTRQEHWESTGQREHHIYARLLVDSVAFGLACMSEGFSVLVGCNTPPKRPYVTGGAWTGWPGRTVPAGGHTGADSWPPNHSLCGTHV